MWDILWTILNAFKTMDISRLNLVISFLIFTLPYPVYPSGILEVRLLHFSNPEGKIANGGCCDEVGYWYTTCEPCDHKFVICIDDIVESSNFRSCRIGRLESGTIKANVISFNDSLGGEVKNPLHFKFKFWPGTVKLKVAVLDIDDVNIQERVDQFEYVFKSSGGRNKQYSLSRMLNMTGSVSSLSLQVNVYCNPHYYGHHCDIFCLKTDSNKGHYTCEKKTGRKICKFGWIGKDCLQNQDDCLYSRCHKDATCIDGMAFYKCQCPPGRTGTLCDMEIDECASNPCLHGGTCHDQLNSYQCTCSGEYTGTNCESNLFACRSNPCLNGATCIQILRSFICLCPKFFEGKTCELDKRAENFCNKKPCNNGKCHPGSTPASYSCHCFPGYTGKYCETNINECLSNPCQHGGSCQDGLNAFHCVCKPTYTGALCERKFYACDSNPCQNGGHCVDGISYFFCRCLEHFDGKQCEIDTRLADPCQSSPCQNGGHCKRTENKNNFICICKTQNTGTLCEIILSTETKNQSLTGNDVDMLISGDSSLEEISTSQKTTFKSSNFPILSEDESLLETDIRDSETSKNIATDKPFSEGHTKTTTSQLIRKTTKARASSSDQDELFSSGHVSGDTSLAEVTEMTPTILLTSRSATKPATKEELSNDLHILISSNQPISQFSTPTKLTTISVSTDFPTDVGDKFSSRREALVSRKSPIMTSSGVSVMKQNLSLTTFHAIENTSYTDKAGNTFYHGKITDNDRTYSPKVTRSFTKVAVTGPAIINMTSSSTPKVNKSDEPTKTDFATTDKTHTRRRSTKRTVSGSQWVKQLRSTTLPLMITSRKIPARWTTPKWMTTRITRATTTEKPATTTKAAAAAKTTATTTATTTAAATTVASRSKTRKPRKTKKTTFATTTARPGNPEICILVKIRPTFKVPKNINLEKPTENERNDTSRVMFSNPASTRRICWVLQRETDFIFPVSQTVKQVSLDLERPIIWVNGLLTSMVPKNNYVLLIKEAIINWVRESLTVFLRYQYTDIPKHLSVFNSTCIIIVIKPKRIGGTASRISSDKKNQEILKMVVCRSAEPTTTPVPSTKSRHGLILRIKVQNETHVEKKTIYPGKPTVVVRVVTTAQKAIEYGKEVATKVYRKTKILLHKTLRRLSGVWKDVQKLSEKLSEPAAASRAVIRKVWNDAWENAQKAYERTQQLIRQAYQKAHETFTRYINNIKAKGTDVYRRTYETYLNYYNDYAKRVRDTAKVFRKNYEIYTDYLRNYWKEIGN